MKSKKGYFLVFVLIASVGAVLAYNYSTFILMRNSEMSLALHQEILNGQAPSPYKYRVLIPFLAEAFAKSISSSGLVSYENSWLSAYIIYYCIIITLFLITLFLFLEQWHGFYMSLVGVLFCGALLPISLRDHYFQPWSLLEAWLYCVAFLATYKQRYDWIVGLTIISSLNRLTGIFIPFIYLLGTLDIRAAIKKVDGDVARQLLRFIVLVAISASIAIGIRNLRGFDAHIYTVGEIWAKNSSVRDMLKSFIHITLFCGAGWIFAIFGLRRSDKFTYQEALLIPAYAMFFAILGVWKEVRLLMPLYPIIISLGLFNIRHRFAEYGASAKKNEARC